MLLSDEVSGHRRERACILSSAVGLWLGWFWMSTKSRAKRLIATENSRIATANEWLGIGGETARLSRSLLSDDQNFELSILGSG